jgi:acetyl-CoA C-acetyltransferase
MPSLLPAIQARTPVGSFQGALKQASAVELGITAVKGVLAQARVEPAQVEDLYFGQVLQGGAGQSPARQVVLGAGMPDTTEATTINKVRCRASTHVFPSFKQSNHIAELTPYLRSAHRE